jgi:hypothetical protein
MPPAPPVDDEENNRTFPYDGGPAVPPPLPMNPPEPTGAPKTATSPYRVASAPTARPVFPAYGEAPASPYRVANRVITSPAVKSVYRAYGESKPGQFAVDREPTLRTVSDR